MLQHSFFKKLQQLTVVEASDFYVFDIIEPPSIMERKSEPVRSLICIIGAFIGALLGCIVVLIRSYILVKTLMSFTYFLTY